MQEEQSEHDEEYYNFIDYEEEIGGEMIPTQIREDFIKNYRLKKNYEIKLTKGYDLFKERLEEWKNATKAMKDDYEIMKKEAQVEEYKFLEKIMIQFGDSNIESEIKENSQR